ncbi:hypothetical protein C8F01DRAFT_1243802 [Mycena amicta]|nr:hypothetical protein C8F01DRAFT_1243802 [Mycena amicta]
MNTLANHGYIPRNGIATFEDIVSGMMEALNVEINFGSFLVAANMLMRGNSFVNKLSIGGQFSLVPPLPYNIGSAAGPGGIALHGGFEGTYSSRGSHIHLTRHRLLGDGSMTRADVHIGDNRNFQDLLYDMDLVQLGKFGDNGPNGNSTVFNLATMVAIKNYNILSDQASDPNFALPVRRFNAMFTEASFILEIFANGTTKQATLPIIGSFLRNQTFPQNWFRPIAPTTGAQSALAIFQGLPFSIFPGHNDENGVYVADPPLPAPFNTSLSCGVYYDLFSQMPAGLANTTGIFQENVKFLTNIVAQNTMGSTCNVTLLPFGLSFD